MKIKQFMFIQKKRRERGEKKRPESGSSPSFEKLTGFFISFEDMRSNLRKVKGHNVMKTFLNYLLSSTYNILTSKNTTFS